MKWISNAGGDKMQHEFVYILNPFSYINRGIVHLSSSHPITTL
jgi:hypothetical protein